MAIPQQKKEVRKYSAPLRMSELEFTPNNSQTFIMYTSKKSLTTSVL